MLAGLVETPHEQMSRGPYACLLLCVADRKFKIVPMVSIVLEKSLILYKAEMLLMSSSQCRERHPSKMRKCVCRDCPVPNCRARYLVKLSNYDRCGLPTRLLPTKKMVGGKIAAKI